MSKFSSIMMFTILKKVLYSSLNISCQKKALKTLQTSKDGEKKKLETGCKIGAARLAMQTLYNLQDV